MADEATYGRRTDPDAAEASLWDFLHCWRHRDAQLVRQAETKKQNAIVDLRQASWPWRRSVIPVRLSSLLAVWWCRVGLVDRDKEAKRKRPIFFFNSKSLASVQYLKTKSRLNIANNFLAISKKKKLGWKNQLDFTLIYKCNKILTKL